MLPRSNLCEPLPSHSHVWLQKGFAETLKAPSSQPDNFLFPWALWALDSQGSTSLLNSKIFYGSLSGVCCKLLWANAERVQKWMLGYDGIDKFLSLLLDLGHLVNGSNYAPACFVKNVEWFTGVISVTGNRMAKDGHGQPEAVCQL